ncbi:PGL/p-HBAD biosynthesis glycosyltransferase [Dyadobacter sp. CECT 9275]|uniref:PGL/p-HBAD biosynthesis glycosyltransferase n=1 Tax=Dyadobacter helix TaxID=2822344 RepID=A0A916J8W0_9BACT|nr:glycosyltransferase [Dyadobacter sp. CECT 9275]CAG4991412.1 PGL/p-HBAD biosynthesis glycosyltransferase [Dyadobacter sp. CECT 9275]
MPLLTIITITFNAERYLRRTLESVKKALAEIENPDSVEYLLIDGNSTDQTLAIATMYGELITRIVSEPDKGLYDAMNKGQSLASGRYLWFLNAGDEIFERRTLHNLLKALNGGADIYYSDAMFVREDGSEVGLRSVFSAHLLPQNLTWKDFSLGMKVCHQAFIAKKSIAPTYLTDNLSADIDWEINCLKNSNNTQYLNRPLCRYLLGGLSVTNHRKSLMGRFTVLRKHFGLLPTLLNHIRIFWRGFIFARRNGKYW